MSKENSQEPGEPSRASWRDPTHYKPLLTLDRAGWAWKWLKRNPDYIARTAQLLTPRRLEWPGKKMRVITRSDAEEVCDWGLHFRRVANAPGRRCLHLLANRLGCVGAGRRDATRTARRQRCF